MTSLPFIEIDSMARNAVDVHCHGVGPFDFTEIKDINLQKIESILSDRSYHSILTLYLPQSDFDIFLKFMEFFALGKKAGLYKHIEGIGLEGPLLASHGGTPHKGVWKPTRLQWQQLAECGNLGLVYVIFSPDALLTNTKTENVSWITEVLLTGGVLPAAGHFAKNNPEISAKMLQAIYNIVSEWGHGATITDHLYNDMPLNFKHAWRSPVDQLCREKEISALKIENWSLDNIDEKLGIVPATMIRNAKKGLVKIAMNFDGEHVDLEIAKRTVELVGAENMLLMTDTVESRRLAGRTLHMRKGSTLLYQDEGVVAAGTQNIHRQIQNMVKIGLTKEEISLITHIVPRALLDNRNQYQQC